MLRRLVFATTLLVLTARPAFAGPPILHHPLDIGSARSLPWNASAYWYVGEPTYDVRCLVDDTLELLTPSMPVIVRMETLRRAGVYASRDGDVAGQLLSALHARVTRDQRDPLAAFDVAYLSAVFRQMARLEYEPQFRDAARRVHSLPGIGNADALLDRARSLRPGDPAFTFAAAIVAAGSNTATAQRLLAEARTGASQNPLLAANLDKLH
jgi:hypothetical protein